jgi:hypothetical protein
MNGFCNNEYLEKLAQNFFVVENRPVDDTKLWWEVKV